MLILGIILVVAGAVVGLGKMPRQKKARARRRKLATSLIVLGVAIGGGQQVQQKVFGPNDSASSSVSSSSASTQGTTKVPQLSLRTTPPPNRYQSLPR